MYQKHFKLHNPQKSVHLTSWPKADEKLIDKEIIAKGDIAANIVGETRRFKAENRLSLKTPIKQLDVAAPQDIKEFERDIKETTKAQELNIKKGEYKTSIILE